MSVRTVVRTVAFHRSHLLIVFVQVTKSLSDCSYRLATNYKLSLKRSTTDPSLVLAVACVPLDWKIEKTGLARYLSRKLKKRWQQKIKQQNIILLLLLQNLNSKIGVINPYGPFA